MLLVLLQGLERASDVLSCHRVNLSWNKMTSNLLHVQETPTDGMQFRWEAANEQLEAAGPSKARRHQINMSA